MKTLVTYYSRTGNTRKVGKQIAKNLKADVDEIIDIKNRRGIFGWLMAGRDASLKNLTEIEYEKDISKFDLVVIGTPVWVGTMTPAIRTYLTDSKFKKIAFFCTCGGQEGKTFRGMQELSKKPVASLCLKSSSLGKKESKQAIKKFCEKLKSR